MAKINQVMVAEINLASPVEELGAVIGAVTGAHPATKVEILKALKDSIEKSIERLENKG